MPADYTFVAADNGVHTFGVTLKTAGTQSLTASDAINNLSASQTGIVVTPAAASTLAVAAFPVAAKCGPVRECLHCVSGGARFLR